LIYFWLWDVTIFFASASMFRAAIIDEPLLLPFGCQ
jgi:hypothetical protein